MKVTSILIAFCFFALKTNGQHNTIPFAEDRPLIDGILKEWDLNIEIPNPDQILKYRNVSRAAWSWDNDYLYIAFEIQDNLLCITQSGNDNPYLYLNDAVEIYIDSHNDSKTRMDLNDYQFIVSLSGESIIFKGDKEKIKEGNEVPKDFGTANILFKAKTTHKGTINNNQDIDSSYYVEIALPWAAIGVEAKSGLEFKIDLAIDDIDTMANIRSWPESFLPQSLSFVNLAGKSDFGFPQDWRVVKLSGAPSGFYKLKEFLNQYLAIVISGSLLLISLMSFLLVLQYRKIRFLRKLPSRAELIAAEATPQIDNNPTFLPFQNSVNTIAHETILKAKEYVESNLDTDFSIDQLSNNLFMSTRQLQRIFKEETDITPRQFITIIRLEKASELLNNTNNNISEVAFACGFSDPAYFTQVFKRYFGVAPSQFKTS